MRHFPINIEKFKVLRSVEEQSVFILEDVKEIEVNILVNLLQQILFDKQFCLPK